MEKGDWAHNHSTISFSVLVVFLGPPPDFVVPLGSVCWDPCIQLMQALLHAWVLLQRDSYLFFAWSFFLFLLFIFLTLHGKFINFFSLHSVVHQMTWYTQVMSHHYSPQFCIESFNVPSPYEFDIFHFSFFHEALHHCLGVSTIQSHFTFSAISDPSIRMSIFHHFFFIRPCKRRVDNVVTFLFQTLIL